MSLSESPSGGETAGSRSILELSCEEARAFFLKQESYCNLDLPPYIQFEELLSAVDKQLNVASLSSMRSGNPKHFEDVNYTILSNKDGRYAWRPIQLIHPALYVSLVRAITEKSSWKIISARFAKFNENDKINCLSMPVESLSDSKDKAAQISHWWYSVEQKSIELALDYEFVLQTDITDCYGSIYTHSIAWAIHTKAEAKKKENRRDPGLIGNTIDWHIQDMRHGQTNGIPQGSVLMDLIAELVLGFADTELSGRIADQKIENYRVLRYRDDFRIFVKNSEDGERILKCLTEVLIELGLKLHASKTTVSGDVMSSSIKEDKLKWMARKQR